MSFSCGYDGVWFISRHINHAREVNSCSVGFFLGGGGVCAALMNTEEIVVLLGFFHLGAVRRFGYKEYRKRVCAV